MCVVVDDTMIVCCCWCCCCCGGRYFAEPKMRKKFIGTSSHVSLRTYIGTYVCVYFEQHQKFLNIMMMCCTCVGNNALECVAVKSLKAI